MTKKIKTLHEIANITHELKRQGKKIVTYNGSFDVLHIGHVRSIQEAKDQGDILILLLNSDRSIQLYKGPNRPIVPQRGRLLMLAALENVDYVCLFNEINPRQALEKIKPNIHCNGSDWGKDCIEREVVERNGGKIHVLKWQKGHSTTYLIKKIINLYKRPAVRAVFFDRDGTINLNRSGYVYRIDDFKFNPFAIEALKKLTKTNYKLIIVTNQSGIGRGIFSQKDFERLNEWMLKALAKEGVRIDRVCHCPHISSDHCTCRKPNIGMLLSAVRDFGISLNDSWFIGNDERDVKAGREANVETIKIGKKMPKELLLEPNYYARDIREAVEIILEKYEEK